MSIVEEMSTFTPPQLAKKWQVSADKVVSFIRSGELRAFDISLGRNKRPRYRIPLDAVEEFEAARTLSPNTPNTTRKRNQRNPDFIKFF